MTIIFDCEILSISRMYWICIQIPERLTYHGSTIRPQDNTNYKYKIATKDGDFIWWCICYGTETEHIHVRAAHVHYLPWLVMPRWFVDTGASDKHALLWAWRWASLTPLSLQTSVPDSATHTNPIIRCNDVFWSNLNGRITPRSASDSEAEVDPICAMPHCRNCIYRQHTPGRSWSNNYDLLLH